MSEDPIPNAEVERMIQEFADVINQDSPDIMIGYNSLKLDKPTHFRFMSNSLIGTVNHKTVPIYEGKNRKME